MHTFNFEITAGTTLSATRTKIGSIPNMETFVITEHSELNKYQDRVVYSVVLESAQLDILLGLFAGLKIA